MFDLQINQRVIELSLPVETESTETKLKGTQHCGLTFRSPHFILPELSQSIEIKKVQLICNIKEYLFYDVYPFSQSFHPFVEKLITKKQTVQNV